MTFTLQVVTSNNMTLEEHIGLIYNAPCTITSFLPVLFTQLISNTMATHAITYTNIVVKCPDYINCFIAYKLIFMSSQIPFIV